MEWLPSESAKNPYAVETIRQQDFARKVSKARIDPGLVEGANRSAFEFPLEDLPGIRSVRSGLRYYHTGILLLTACWMLERFATFRGGGPLVKLAMLGTALGLLIVLIGELKCLAVPRRNEGYIYVWTSSAFFGLGVLVHFAKQVAPLQAPAGLAIWIQLNIMELLLGFVANILFLTFMIYLTEYLQNPALHVRAVRTRNDIWKMIAFVFVVFIVFVFFAIQKPMIGRKAANLVLGVGSIGFLILLFAWARRFSRLVKDTSRAIVIKEPSGLVPPV